MLRYMQVWKNKGWVESFLSSKTLGIFLIAMAARLFYLSQVADSPLFDSPVVDSLTYVDQARDIVGGNWLGFGKGPFWQPPFYPYFLALVRLIFKDQFFWAVRLIQIVLGSLGCVLIFLISRRFFNTSVGIIASLLGALYGILIYFDCELLPASIALFLDLLLILSLLEASERPRLSKWLLSGFIFGLSAITVPNVLALAPFILLWMWIAFGSRSNVDSVLSADRGTIETAEPKLERGVRTSQFAVWCGSFLLGGLLVISTVTLRNYVVGGDFVIISYNAGINFYIGNNPDYDRTVGIRPGWEWENLSFEPLEKGIDKHSESSRYFFSKAWEFIRDQPLAYFKLLCKKLFLFWNGNEIGRNQEIYFSRGNSSLMWASVWKRIIAFPFGVLSPLALVGLIISLPRWRKLLLLYIFVTVYAASVVLFLVTSRYRLPVLPFLMIFAAYTIWWWFQSAKGGRYLTLSLSVVPFVLFTLAANTKIGKMDTVNNAEVHYNVGTMYMNKQMHASAIVEFEKVVSLKEDYWEAWLNLGSIYARMGMYDDSIAASRKVAEARPSLMLARPLWVEGYIQTRLFLAQNYIQLGMYDRAQDECESALKLDPDNVKVRLKLAYIYDKKGLYDAAVDEYRKIIRTGGDYLEARNNLGVVYAKKGLLDEAIAEFTRLLESQPQNLDARYNLAAAYKEKGKYKEATAQYEEILKIESDYSDVRLKLALLYKEMSVLKNEDSVNN